jgi:signal transduction histidine kinase
MKIILAFCLLFFIVNSSLAQNQVEILTTQEFDSHERIYLAPLNSWLFKKGDVENGEKVDLNVDNWDKFKPTQLSTVLEDQNDRVEGWFRIKIRLDESLLGIPLAISRDLWAATDIYINGELLHSFGDTGEPYEAWNPTLKYPIPVDLVTGKDYLIAIHFVDYETTFTQRELRLQPRNLQRLINLTGPAYITKVTDDIKDSYVYGALSISVSFLLFFLFWLLVFLNPNLKVFKLIAVLTSFTLLAAIGGFIHTFYELTYPQEKIRFLIEITLQPISTIFGLLILEWILTNKISVLSKAIFALILLTNLLAHLFSISLPFGIVFISMLSYMGFLLYTYRGKIKGAQFAIVASLVVPTISAFVWITIHKYSLDLFYEYDEMLTSFLTLGAPVLLLIYISVRFKELFQEVSDEAEKVLRVTEEKKKLLSQQNILLEVKVSERTNELNKSLEDLKSTQTQLIHSEKMASLGELTAGIAHEIQNPLNFVNNFSEVSSELIDEMEDEIEEGNTEDVKEIASDLKQNLEKINHHGHRASDIVKGMLEHSRTGDGAKELTDINKLADEYLRLSYHGLRAKDKSFNADFTTDFDESLPQVKVVPQDIGRVLLNLINNAFQAVSSTDSGKVDKDYKPTVTVSTKKEGNKIEIRVKDNGSGIPDDIKDKIFQPFFTTKPTGQGTGLGLSMSYDIITKGHGGELKVESKEEEGTEFIIQLPYYK